MVLFDVNILVNTANRQSTDHQSCRDWLDRTIKSDGAFGAADLVFSGFLRISTNRRIFPQPLTPSEALQTVETVRSRRNCVVIQPGARHWDIFVDLCRRANARGNLVPDAYLAALAIESGSEWITTDRDYARFPGLRWRHPLDG